MISQFEYMRIRQVLETIFHDDMDIPLEIIKIIQDYHNDDEFVPKIEYCYDVKLLEKTIRFVIDSAFMFVNGVPVVYTIALYVSDYEYNDIRDYKLKINVKAKPQDSEPIEQVGYIYGTFDSHDMLQCLKSGKYGEDIAKMIGAVVWKIQKTCTASAKQYLNTLFGIDNEYAGMEPKPIDLEEE